MFKLILSQNNKLLFLHILEKLVNLRVHYVILGRKLNSWNMKELNLCLEGVEVIITTLNKIIYFVCASFSPQYYGYARFCFEITEFV